MLGYPGAGKTTTALILKNLTGATHLWADQVRRERFQNPKHTHEENIELYDYLNQLAGELLGMGKSVIFDTNFNYYKDRQKLRQIADKQGATTKLIWVKTPKESARQRATAGAEGQNTRVLGDMSPEVFERISSNLEPPHSDEQVMEVEGDRISPPYIEQLIKADS